MKRAFYSDNAQNFLLKSEETILGELSMNNPFALEDTQRNAWVEQVRIMKEVVREVGKGHVAFEYTIPRIGNRVDIIYIVDNIVFLLEFKIGAHEHTRYAIEQVTDYALDLKNFHRASRDCLLVPIAISKNAPDVPYRLTDMKPGISEVLVCNRDTLKNAINSSLLHWTGEEINANNWIASSYSPTPTIIEAAQVLYRQHNVADISRNDASAINLSQTTDAVNKIIEKSKREYKKSICFISGVPGAGKTLAGLNIANERQKFDENEHAVFLSGNQPLVTVLQEALARDEHVRMNIKKTEAMRKAKSFIQIIHHFRDDAIATTVAPHEKVAIFDEAQRAWTQAQLTDFMARKKGRSNFIMSEPEFLIDVMNRHDDWAVIVCLIGGGQEINTGEAGLIEWFNSLRNKFSHWDVYVSNKITDSEYTRGLSLEKLFQNLRCTVIEPLHLSVSLRSFRSENVAGFVKALLDVDISSVKSLYETLHNDYPIVITRELEKAKNWVRSQANGTERYGLVASSGAKRLRALGVWVQSQSDNIAQWFLNDITDVRSSYFLEDTATEFDIQGLELDWTIMCWDVNLRFVNGRFEHYKFQGAKWLTIRKEEDVLYLKNAYRVLLTRARQGMVIFLPPGSDTDPTRPHEYYDGIYVYLKSIGIKEI
ncbi:MAG: DUF2075 domain-containing protein [Defluviitaleaceae bacterium]|nr:DUF2075 domain-containing protein [Defluviitaleaceae bacterium]